MPSRPRSVVGRRARPAVLALTSATTIASLAAAQSPAAPAAPTASSSASAHASVSAVSPLAPSAPSPLAAYPDIVRLRSGAFLRGTVLEHDPAGQTVIRTDAGVRSVKGADVVYAGPVANDPGAAGAGVSGSGPTLSVPAGSASATPGGAVPAPVMDKQVHFRAFSPNVRYLVSSVSKPDAEGLHYVCTAPCEAPLDRGAYRVALATGTRGPYLVRDNVELVPGSTVEGRILDRQNTRLFGWGLAGVSLIPAIGGLVAAAFGKGTVKQLGPVVSIGGFAGIGAGLLISRAQDIAEVSPVDPPKPEKSARGFSLHMSRTF